jgi:hypothetical protein
MPYSALKELFGEFDPEAKTSKGKKKKVTEKKVVKSKKKVKKKNKNNKLIFPFLIAFFFLFILLGTSFFLWDRAINNIPEEDKLLNYPELSEKILSQNSLDRFVKNFSNNIYKVDDSGAFAYIYEDVDGDLEVEKNGIISLGDGSSDTEGYTYFKNGQLVYLDVDDEIEVIWDEYNRKHVLLKNEKKYFVVKNSSDLYYRYYVGQHIVKDFVNEYLKNKDFITQVDEYTWSWDWSFYTPVDFVTKHSMKAEVKLNPETDYIEEIRLLDGDNEVCVYKFVFEKVETLDTETFLKGYELAKESELVL